MARIDFEDIEVWQKARKLTRSIYTVGETGKLIGGCTRYPGESSFNGTKDK